MVIEHLESFEEILKKRAKEIEEEMGLEEFIKKTSEDFSYYMNFLLGHDLKAPLYISVYMTILHNDTFWSHLKEKFREIMKKYLGFLFKNDSDIDKFLENFYQKTKEFLKFYPAAEPIKEYLDKKDFEGFLERYSDRYLAIIRIFEKAINHLLCGIYLGRKTYVHILEYFFEDEHPECDVLSKVVSAGGMKRKE